MDRFVDRGNEDDAEDERPVDKLALDAQITGIQEQLTGLATTMPVGGADPFADAGPRPVRPFLLLCEGRRGLMSDDIPASVARSFVREFFRKSGRLLPEQFRERLDECEVIHELTRRALWCGDGPARRGDGHHGFTFGDLWKFYCYCNSPKDIAAENEKSRSGKRLIESARLIRKGFDVVARPSHA